MRLSYTASGRICPRVRGPLQGQDPFSNLRNTR